MESKRKSSPRVSVVIPTYNSAKYTEGAVESVLAQTMQDFEIVLVDDGSEPESARLLVNLAHLDKSRLLRLEENQGPARARRYGWNMAQGEYVSFLDNDDRYEKQYLEQCLAYLGKNPEWGAVYTRYVWLNEDGQRGRIQPECGYSGWIFTHEVKKSRVKTSTLMVRREHLLMLSGLLEHLRGPENYDMILRLCYNHKFGFIEDTLVNVISREGSLSHTAAKSRLGRIEILESFLATYPDMNRFTRRTVQRKIAHYCIKQGEFLAKEGRKRESLALFRKALENAYTLRGLSRYLTSLASC